MTIIWRKHFIVVDGFKHLVSEMRDDMLLSIYNEAKAFAERTQHLFDTHDVNVCLNKECPTGAALKKEIEKRKL